MPEPKIISSYDPGFHNTDLEKTVLRLNSQASYKDLSTFIIVPGFESVPGRVFMSWWSMITPPNGKIHRFMTQNMEVGNAYSTIIEMIINHPELSKWKYLCFIEHDNIIPQDGLVKLLAQMEAHPEFAAISGLYFTKGFNGAAQIWGDIKDPIINYRPQRPDPNGGLVECYGIGQGFAVFRLDMFKDSRLIKPWFKTKCSKEEGVGTQDLSFWSDARKYGYRCAVDCSIKVSHYDMEGKFGIPDMAW